MKSPSIQRSFSPIIASDTELEDLPSITTQDTPMETQDIPVENQDIPVQGFSGSSNTSESSIQMTMLANISSTLNDVVKRIDQAESRLKSIEQKLSTSNRNHELEKKEVPTVVRVCYPIDYCLLM